MTKTKKLNNDRYFANVRQQENIRTSGDIVTYGAVIIAIKVSPSASEQVGGGGRTLLI